MTKAEIRGTLELPGAIRDAIVAHALSDFPFETCGLLGGRDGVVTSHHLVPNAARSMTFYTMEPRALLAAMDAIDDDGEDLLGIWHSHTHTEAFPSPTDVELAFYPEASYVLLSLQERDAPVVRAFDIVDGRITERVVTVDGSSAPTGRR